MDVDPGLDRLLTVSVEECESTILEALSGCQDAASLLACLQQHMSGMLGAPPFLYLDPEGTDESVVSQWILAGDGLIAAGIPVSGGLALPPRAWLRISHDGTQQSWRMLRFLGVLIEVLLLRDEREVLRVRDRLTGVFRREYAQQFLTQEMARAARERWSVSILRIDIDFMRHINATFGDRLGDTLLRAVASRLSGQLRGAELLARFSGDEFIVLLGRAGVEVADVVARRLLRSINTAPMMLGQTSVHVTVSVGVAESRPRTVFEIETCVQQLLDEAGLALDGVRGRAQVGIARRPSAMK